MNERHDDERHDAPRGADVMNVVRWVLLVGLVALAALSVTGYFMSRGSGPATHAASGVARYYCPMHPSYTSDRPGECPICGMTLEPIPAGGLADSTAGGDVPGLTTVNLSADRIQMIGVRTAPVTRAAFGGRLELVGFVTPDEARLHRVQLRVAGWIQQVHGARTGETVTAGQPLVDLYSPELYQSEREYLIEHGVADTTSPMAHEAAMPAMSHEAGAAEAARARLKLLGVPVDEMNRLDRERTASTRLTLRSPVSGTVLERNVSEGQYVSADTPLMTIADLTRLWVLADLYEMDLGRVAVGSPATFTADGLPGEPFAGRIEFVYPTVSNETRTLKVRLALTNANRALKPGMYGRVRIAGRSGPALSVPTEAIVNTGDDRYVFLARAGGHFEPRRVRVGRASGERTEVLDGVAEGDTVVASASFLIDSESRLKAAIAGMGAQPATGHAHESRP